MIGRWQHGRYISNKNIMGYYPVFDRMDIWNCKRLLTLTAFHDIARTIVIDMNTRTLYKKNKREWIEVDRLENNNTAIAQSLNNEMINKYLYKSNWVKRIELDYYYSSDQQKITVYFDNGYKHVYTLDR